MMGKRILWIIGALLVIGLIALFLNRETLQRLHRVNTLFSEKTIVHNFSNMNEVLPAHTLPATGPAHEWPETPQALPETVTINGEPRNLEAFLEETQTTALLVIRDGNILAEDYFLGTDREDKRISWSVAKSFLSALFGIAVDDGRIESLNDPISHYAPALKGSAYEGVPIRNVLNMASGVKFNEDYLDPKSDINKMGRVLALGGSMDEFTAGLTEREREPGTGRQYVSIDTHALAMALRAASGQSLHDFFMDNLWSKIGPGADAYYSTDGEDTAFALGGLNMRTRDFALFGQLMLQNGVWDGEQVIPAAWVSESTRASAPPDTEASGVNYGYQWWVPIDSNGDFFAVGVYGQYIYVNPQAGMVIVKNSAHREFLENGRSGKVYKLETIDMFRSLVDSYRQ